jgi:hypothetical protein
MTVAIADGNHSFETVCRSVMNECEPRTLAALHETLRPKLIFGEVLVKDVEWFLREHEL